MGVDAQGWLTWAIKDPGPPERVNSGTNTLKLFIPHSAEGYWPHLRAVLWGDRGSSWFASNLRDGRFIQHYPIWARTWTSGSGYPNNNGLAWETEGVAGEPFTPEQTANCIRVIKDVSAVTGMTAWRRPMNSRDLDAQLYEHNECTRWGSLATACPSKRVPWAKIIAGLTEEDDDMKPIRIWCAERSKTYLVGPFGAVPVVSAADDKVFETLYGAHAAVLTGAQVDELLKT